MKYIKGIIVLLLITMCQPIWAAGPPAPSLFDSGLAIILFTLMILLLIIIGVLGYILIGAATVAVKRQEEEKRGLPQKTLTALLLFAFLTTGPAVLAQDNNQAAGSGTQMIGGITSTAFYIMTSVIFLELTIILVLLFNVRALLEKEKVKVSAKVLSIEEIREEKKTRLNWWDRFNKLKPVSQEAELDLGHEYDGIRELNNRLPPWWLYGFYATIVFAVVYLWRFHVSHTAPSSKQEYEMSVANAEQAIKDYLKAKGEAVDENTVTLLTTPDDLAAGKTIFLNSCAACHTPTGAGNVGPNLTDNFWLHGNTIQDVFKTIRYGINAMPQWQNTYSNKQIAQVASYVKSLLGTNPANPKPPQGIEIKEETAPVPHPADSLNNKVVTK